MYSLNIDKKTNRILSATFSQYGADDMPRVNLLPTQEVTVYAPDMEQVVDNGESITDYLYIDGEYVYDPLPKPEAEPEPTPTTAYVSYDELAKAIREGVNSYNGQ